MVFYLALPNTYYYCYLHYLTRKIAKCVAGPLPISTYPNLCGYCTTFNKNGYYVSRENGFSQHLGGKYLNLPTKYFRILS